MALIIVLESHVSLQEQIGVRRQSECSTPQYRRFQNRTLEQAGILC